MFQIRRGLKRVTALSTQLLCNCVSVPVTSEESQRVAAKRTCEDYMLHLHYDKPKT